MIRTLNAFLSESTLQLKDLKNVYEQYFNPRMKLKCGCLADLSYFNICPLSLWAASEVTSVGSLLIYTMNTLL